MTDTNKVDVETVGQYRGDGTFHWYPPHPKHIWKDVDLVPASALAAQKAYIRQLEDANTPELVALRAQLQEAQADASRYRWLAKEHGWLLLKHFPPQRPYCDPSEVIDEAIDAALKGEVNAKFTQFGNPESVRNAKPVEPDGPVKVHMRCQDCGHEQTVRGNRLNGATYFGSGYDFCDKCDGPPRLIPDIEGVPV